MGVPAFFKWLARKYPKILSCCTERKGDRNYSAPNPNTIGDREFDNLYLDMNGIIHPCFHPEGVAPPRSEEEIFYNVDQYVLRLFNIVRPRKVLFMAIDGVAPRAKMNQQRMRRYRSAKDNAYTLQKKIYEAQERDDLDELQILNDPDYLTKHDSNVITPGTPFFGRLANHLREFVRKQQETDPGWAKVLVFLSDASVPGEGEHKIMDFVRFQRSQPQYDPNTHHCIYGLDADLIFLGLATHEVYFTIIREYDAMSEKNPDREFEVGPEYFHFVSLWVLRQYLERDLKPRYKMNFEWNFEFALDDFIFLCFATGNDFLPALPGFSIYNRAIDTIITTYNRTLPQLGAYITRNAKVDLPRFVDVIKTFTNCEQKGLDEVLYPTEKAMDMQILVNKICDTDNPVYEPPVKEDDEKRRRSRSRDDQMKPIEELKSEYYIKKFEIEEDQYPEKVSGFVVEFIRGMIWVLNYYLHGCISWSWYYPYHNAPCASDFGTIDVNNKTIDVFELSAPFKPLVQLMAVLPPQSSHCLPPVMKYLMCDANSPLKEFYPTHFTVDLNGGSAIWKGHVHVPFIDETKLMKALDEHPLHLTPEEESRNQFGKTRIFMSSDIAPPASFKDQAPLKWHTFGTLNRLYDFDPEEKVTELAYQMGQPREFLSFLIPGVVMPPYCIDERYDSKRSETFWDKGAFNVDDVEYAADMPLQIPGVIPGQSFTSREKLVQKLRETQQFMASPPGFPPNMPPGSLPPPPQGFSANMPPGIPPQSQMPPGFPPPQMQQGRPPLQNFQMPPPGFPIQQIPPQQLLQNPQGFPPQQILPPQQIQQYAGNYQNPPKMGFAPPQPPPIIHHNKQNHGNMPPHKTRMAFPPPQ